SSVVEHSLGKGEVDSSILSGSTSQSLMNSHEFLQMRGFPVFRSVQNAARTRVGVWHRTGTACSRHTPPPRRYSDVMPADQAAPSSGSLGASAAIARSAVHTRAD